MRSRLCGNRRRAARRVDPVSSTYSLRAFRRSVRDASTARYNGDAWICSPAGEPDAWGRNLGPWEGAAEAMSQWLGSLDYDEVEARRDRDL